MERTNDLDLPAGVFKQLPDGALPGCLGQLERFLLQTQTFPDLVVVYRLLIQHVEVQFI